MAKLLYIEASPRKDRSASIEISRAFLEAYTVANPNDEVDTLVVWAPNLPEFNGEALTAKYAGLTGVPLTDEQKAVWADIHRLAGSFLAAGKLLFALPMWNFGIPYRLKQLIDLISREDIVFAFDGTDFRGLLKAPKPRSYTRAAWIIGQQSRRRRRRLLIFKSPAWKCGFV